MDARKRSTLITLGAIGVSYAALRTISGLWAERLEFQPMPSPAGFRSYVAGGTSGRIDPFVGVSLPQDAGVTARQEAAAARVSGDLCGALYGDMTPGDGKVGIASFSDYYCPFCRVQTRYLAEMSDQMPGEISVTWHELPLLGEGSVMAARAALAAKRQGAYVGFHERLMSTRLLASPVYVARLADELGVDAAQLVADMDGADVARELADSAALARVFRLIGTPALVIGRTVVLGQVSARQVRKIVDLEREEGWAAVCASA